MDPDYLKRMNADVPYPIDELYPFVTAESSSHDGTAWILYSLGKNMKARYALEVGTAFGYTALYLAQIPTVERVWTVDIKACEEARKNFERFDWGRKIRAFQGDSKKIDLKIKPGQVDLAYLDSDYDTVEYTVGDFYRTLPLMRKGGIIVYHDNHQVPIKKGLDEIRKKFAVIDVGVTSIIGIPR